MTKKQMYLLFCVSIVLWGCSSTKVVLNNKINALRDAIKTEIPKSRIRDEKEALDFQTRIHNLKFDNPSSEVLLNYLQRNSYIEENIRSCFSEKIAEIILQEFFGEQYALFSTDYIQVKINNINFSAEYLCNHMDIPTIVSLIYITEDDDPKKMRLFYKVNYFFEYSTIGALNNGKKCYIFY